MSADTSAARPPRWTEYLPLDEVLRAPRNPKKHDAQIIRASMERFGVVELPALDERTGRLVAGHGRLEDWKTRRDTGEAPPEGVQCDDAGQWLVPVSRGWSSRTDAEAEAYLVVSNRSVEIGGWFEVDLDKMLTDIAREDFALAQVTGTTSAELEELLDAAEAGVDLAAVHALAATDAEPTAYADPAAEAPWMASTAPQYDRSPRRDDDLIEHDAPPATGARYAETPEQEATRSERITAYQPRTSVSAGTTEVVMVYTLDDRDELRRLVAAVRETLGRDLKASDITLRALRVLVAVLDGRGSDRAVRLNVLAQRAGWVEPQAADQAATP